MNRALKDAAESLGRDKRRYSTKSLKKGSVTTMQSRTNAGGLELAIMAHQKNPGIDWALHGRGQPRARSARLGYAAREEGVAQPVASTRLALGVPRSLPHVPLFTFFSAPRAFAPLKAYKIKVELQRPPSKC